MRVAQSMPSSLYAVRALQIMPSTADGRAAWRSATAPGNTRSRDTDELLHTLLRSETSQPSPSYVESLYRWLSWPSSLAPKIDFASRAPIYRQLALPGGTILY